MTRTASSPASGANDPPAPLAPTPERAELPVVSGPSQFAEISRPAVRRTEPWSPRRVERGVVIFDLDGTILDDLNAISRVAADVMHQAFATPREEARIHYLATTGMPFEAQLAQLYPDVPAEVRASVARTFHQRKVTEAYAHAGPFPEVPKLLKRLSEERWTLAISTGAETEMAELLLEREGLRFWFEDVLGSADGTKREHLREYRRRYPEVPIFLVGDSRFDMEASLSVEGVLPLARASRLPHWTLAPSDLRKWGAVWAGFSLGELPSVIARLATRRARPATSRTGRRRRS